MKRNLFYAFTLVALCALLLAAPACPQATTPTTATTSMPTTHVPGGTPTPTPTFTTPTQSTTTPTQPSVTATPPTITPTPTKTSTTISPTPSTTSAPPSTTSVPPTTTTTAPPPTTTTSAPPTTTATVTATGQTAAQLSAAGQTVFNTRCEGCHGGGGAPTVIGAGASLAKYATAQGLYGKISSTMPAANPGSLTQQQYLEVTTYILLQNNYVTANMMINMSVLAGISLAR